MQLKCLAFKNLMWFCFTCLIYTLFTDLGLQTSVSLMLLCNIIQSESVLFMKCIHVFVQVQWCVWRLGFRLPMNVQRLSFHAWTSTVMKSLLFFIAVSLLIRILSHAAGTATSLESCIYFIVYYCLLIILFIIDILVHYLVDYRSVHRVIML